MRCQVGKAPSHVALAAAGPAAKGRCIQVWHMHYMVHVRSQQAQQLGWGPCERTEPQRAHDTQALQRRTAQRGSSGTHRSSRWQVPSRQGHQGIEALTLEVFTGRDSSGGPGSQPPVKLGVVRKVPISSAERFLGMTTGLSPRVSMSGTSRSARGWTERRGSCVGARKAGGGGSLGAYYLRLAECRQQWAKRPLLHRGIHIFASCRLRRAGLSYSLKIPVSISSSLTEVVLLGQVARMGGSPTAGSGSPAKVAKAWGGPTHWVTKHQCAS